MIEIILILLATVIFCSLVIMDAWRDTKKQEKTREKRIDRLIQEKSHEVYRENGEAYEVVTVEDLREAMKNDT